MSEQGPRPHRHNQGDPLTTEQNRPPGRTTRLIGQEAVGRSAEHPSPAEAWRAAQAAVLVHLRSGRPDEELVCPGLTNGRLTPRPRRANDLPTSPADVRRVNNQIVAAYHNAQDPVAFLRECQALIESSPGRHTEYPATALKKAIDLIHTPQATVTQAYMDAHPGLAEYVNLMVRQTFGAADHRFQLSVGRPTQRDLNIIELTNLNSAISRLPRGVIDPAHTSDILRHNLAHLTEMSQPAEQAMVAAIGRLDLSQHGASAASILTLSMRHAYTFGRSHDLLVMVRTLTRLPPFRAASNDAFMTLAGRSNQLHVKPPDSATGCQVATGLCLLDRRGIITAPDARQTAQVMARDAIAATRQLIKKHLARGGDRRVVAQDQDTLGKLDDYLAKQAQAEP